MATHHDPQEQGILHDKLKDQIAISIKESLDKATIVLSNLHRVHSYLDVLKSMPSFRSGSGGEGLKNALDQVRSIRTDAAALLQTIYLTEIGLQSLQDVDKQVVCTPTNDVSLLPILGDSTGLPEPVMNSSQDNVVEGRAVVELTGGQEVTDTGHAHPADTMPPAKKMNLGVIITSCNLCNRKFATNQIDPQQGAKCKNCRSNGTSSSLAQTTVLPTTVLKGMSLPGGATHPVLSSTPLKSSPTAGSKSKVRKVSNPPVSCKVCGISFVYRRCLFRHLRENHPGIDLNNIHEYIETEKMEEVRIEDDSTTAPGSQNTSMNVTVGSEIVPAELEEGGMDDQSSLDQVLGEGRDSGEEGSEEKKGVEDSEKRVYTCTICNKVFDRPYRLTRHIQIHDPNRPRVTCQVCDRSFTRFDTLENHMKSMHSDERPYHCQYPACQKSFATQSTLINHLKVHTDGKPYKCLECDNSFTLLLEYKQHVRQAHPDTENRCSDCYKVLPDMASLESHRSVEHRLECEICGKTFARLAYLQLHVEVHSGERVFNCKFCSQGFDSEYTYKQHMKTHPENQRNKKGFHCQLCDKSFEEPSNLIAHYRSQEHRDKATSLGIGADTTILNTIEGDLSDMNALVDEVAMATNQVPIDPVVMGTNAVTNEETKMIASIAGGDSFQPRRTANSLSTGSVPTSQEHLQNIADQTL